MCVDVVMLIACQEGIIAVKEVDKCRMHMSVLKPILFE